MEVGAAIFLWGFVIFSACVMIGLVWYACSGICVHCLRQRRRRNHQPLLNVDEEEEPIGITPVDSMV